MYRTDGRVIYAEFFNRARREQKDQNKQQQDGEGEEEEEEEENIKHERKEKTSARSGVARRSRVSGGVLL